MLDELDVSIAAAQQLMLYARHPDGTVRNAKLLAHATEALRRCVDTKQRVLERVRENMGVEAFHAAVIEEVRQEAPGCADRIQRRLDTMMGGWGTSAPGA